MVMHVIRSPRDTSPGTTEPDEQDGDMRLDLFPSEHEGAVETTDAFTSLESTFESERRPSDPDRPTAEALPTARDRDPLTVAFPETRQPRRFRIDLLAGLALLAVVGTGAVYYLRTPVAVGSLRVETDTVGAEVVVDGQPEGKTPLLLVLPAGDHTVQISQGGASRTLDVTITEQTTVVHHVSLPASPAPPVTTGGIEIVSDPVGQNVTVDGQPRGVTPVTVTGLSPGAHEVIVRRDTRFVQRTVQVAAGKTMSLLLTPGPTQACRRAGSASRRPSLCKCSKARSWSAVPRPLA